jgi:hypothetical protein
LSVRRIPNEPRAVIIMLGTNDTKPQNWKHEIVICTDYRDLVNPFIELESKSSVLFADPARSSGN